MTRVRPDADSMRKHAWETLVILIAASFEGSSCHYLSNPLSESIGLPVALVQQRCEQCHQSMARASRRSMRRARCRPTAS